MGLVTSCYLVKPASITDLLFFRDGMLFLQLTPFIVRIVFSFVLSSMFDQNILAPISVIRIKPSTTSKSGGGGRWNV